MGSDDRVRGLKDKARDAVDQVIGEAGPERSEKVERASARVREAIDATADRLSKGVDRAADRLKNRS